MALCIGYLHVGLYKFCCNLQSLGAEREILTPYATGQDKVYSTGTESTL